MSVDVTRAAVLRVEIGAPQTGKSSALRAWVRGRRPTRLIVVDPDGEHADLGFTTRDPRALLAATRGTTFAAVFSGDRRRQLSIEDFAFACRLAYDRAPCVLIVDELADFVRPGESESPWATAARHGRKYGLEVAAGCQRPALLDKSLWSMATWICARRLNYSRDRETVADALGVDRTEVAALQGHDWIARDCWAGVVTRSIGRPAGRESMGKRGMQVVK